MLDETIKEAYLVDVTTADGRNPYRTITEKLQTHADLQEESIKMCQLNAVCVVPPWVLSTMDIITNVLQDSQRMRSVRPGPYIVKKKVERFWRKSD